MTMIPCMVPKIWSITDRVFCCFGPFVCPFTTLTTQKIKILKKWEKLHKQQSHDVWCLRYGLGWTECFVIFDHFLLSNNPKSQNFENIKKPQEISFCTSVPKIIIICCVVAEIWLITDLISIFHFGLFFALNPPNNQKNQHF